MKKNKFIKSLIGYSNYVDKLVYVTVDGGRREIIKLKPKRKRFYNSLAFNRSLQKMIGKKSMFEL